MLRTPAEPSSKSTYNADLETSVSRIINDSKSRDASSQRSVSSYLASTKVAIPTLSSFNKVKEKLLLKSKLEIQRQTNPAYLIESEAAKEKKKIKAIER
jgi:tRNA uridine 5-carbamoylmethylation protein Kti12